jgi:hypothetical protein
MLTLFTTAKPFEGHNGIIQRNALKSWKLLHPDIEIILFGDDAGGAEIANELGFRHELFVERNKFGTKRLDYIFRRAQELARHEFVCYCNCDIILLPEFCGALKRVADAHEQFLMIGRRWDTDITEAIDFDVPDWSRASKAFAEEHGVEQPGYSVDYFAFRRGFYASIPPLVIGRIWWDHWLVWKARQQGAAVVDVSEQVTTIHQNHNYGYHPAGARGVWTDEQAAENYRLAGGRWHLFTIDDATHILRERGEAANPRRFWAPYWRYLRPKCIPIWFAILDATRPLRKLFGLRQAVLDAALRKNRR